VSCSGTIVPKVLVCTSECTKVRGIQPKRTMPMLVLFKGSTSSTARVQHSVAIEPFQCSFFQKKKDFKNKDIHDCNGTKKTYIAAVHCSAVLAIRITISFVLVSYVRCAIPEREYR
jgi:hypothetical protein